MIRRVYAESTYQSNALHHLPFAFVNYSGPARVSSFFLVNHLVHEISDPDQSSYYQSFFRGKELRGTIVNLPEDSIGLVLRSSCSVCEKSVANDVIDDETEEEENSQNDWIVEKYFREFFYWNREQTPSRENDRVYKWLQWNLLASVIHHPVSPQEIEGFKRNMSVNKEVKETEEKEKTQKRQRTNGSPLETQNSIASTTIVEK